MALTNVLNITGSALSAQSVRLNTTSSNLANAESVTSSLDQAYRARQPVFGINPIGQTQDSFGSLFDQVSQDQGAGVQVLGIVESAAPLRQEYQPNHPLANEEGYVTLPNVNVVEELANMISASRSYQTNVEVANAAKDMLQRTLSLGNA